MLATMRQAATLVCFALLLAAGCDAEPTAAPSPSPQASPTEEPTASPTPVESPAECSDETVTGEDDATLHLNDNAFSPDCIIVLGGQALELENEGLNRHNFSIQGQDVDIDVNPGRDERTDAAGTLAEAGTFTFFCKYHRSLGMEGEITIVEAG
jgi:plastocyanin